MQPLLVETRSKSIERTKPRSIRMIGVPLSGILSCDFGLLGDQPDPRHPQDHKEIRCFYPEEVFVPSNMLK
jgi:hypothetical protein